MTHEQKQAMVEEAVAAAIHSLKMGWEEGNGHGEEHFLITVHNADQSLFADGGANFS